MLSGGMVILWTILFALSFDGASAEIDWTELASGESSDSGGHLVDTLRNIVQIISEIIIGASLFLVIDRTQATYSAQYSRKNPKWNAANKRVEALEGPTKALGKEADAADAIVLQMQAARDVYVGEALSILRDIQNSKTD